MTTAAKKMPIADIFSGIGLRHIKMLVTDQKALIKAILTYLAGLEAYSPAPELIFNAFRLCPNPRVVIIGEDPYSNGATGLSFSSGNTPIPGSLRNIYECLKAHGLITHMPNHADLSTWARQGVLLLNMALTIAPDAKHMKVWKKYMEHIVVALRAAYPQLIFVLFGGKAAAAIDSAIPGGSAQMLCWAHPSPASTHNNDKTAPSHFINCTVFTAVNTILGRLKQSPINWNSVNAPEAHHLFDDLVCAQELGVDYLPPVPHDEIMWIFTDGAASANGKANCRASWAYSIVWKSPINICYKNAYGNVVECEDAKPSNNRGELLAILNALKTIDQIYGANIATTPQIAICTDSQYSIGCISVWAGNWLKQAAQAERKNLDLIYPAHHIYKKYGTKIVFTHIRSHRPPPPKEEGLEFFKWRGNELADSLCSLAQLGAAQ